jgi:hypothetical protein
MTRLQQIGVLLIALHIVFSFTGVYRAVSAPSYDVYVYTGNQGYLFKDVRVGFSNLCVVPDSSGVLVLYSGVAGKEISVSGVKSCDIVAVRKPLLFPW